MLIYLALWYNEARSDSLAGGDFIDHIDLKFISHITFHFEFSVSGNPADDVLRVPVQAAVVAAGGCW